MLGFGMAISFKGVMQQLKMSVDRQLLAGMVARAVGVTMLTKVGNDWAGRRHEPADTEILRMLCLRSCTIFVLTVVIGLQSTCCMQIFGSGFRAHDLIY